MSTKNNQIDFISQTNQEHTEGKRNSYVAVPLKYEYKNYSGEYRYCIYTQLTEEEPKKLHGAEIEKYEPYLIMSWEQYEVRADFIRNEDKFKKRNSRSEGLYGYEDGKTECIHSELRETDVLEQVVSNFEVNRLMEALEKLTPTQKRRVIARFFEKKSSRTIAAEEGVNYSKVDNSINAALKKLKNLLT